MAPANKVAMFLTPKNLATSPAVGESVFTGTQVDQAAGDQRFQVVGQCRRIHGHQFCQVAGANRPPTEYIRQQGPNLN